MTGERDRFLDELGRSANISFACRAAGWTREQALALRASDGHFEQLWRTAERLADLRARRRDATR